ncbi:MAG: TspO/MBR family protein [Candidatus Nanopelagicales bacterium]
MTLRSIYVGLAVGLVFIYAIGSGLWVSSGDGWYQSLNRPSWQPPSSVFGLIWPYNFVMLGFVGELVTKNGTNLIATLWLMFLVISVASALVWTRLFYVNHALGASGFALSLAALSTVPLTIMAFRYSMGAGIAMVPYNIWLFIAASLAFGYSYLN